MTFIPRPKQQQVLNYDGGYMGVAAVPGAGKTRTLSALAVRILTEFPLDDDQEVLIVTLVNAAVGNFARQIRTALTGQGMIAGYGYRVRTLHGLANDIVRERPDLVGLDTNFAIADEREASQILDAAVQAWLRGHPNELLSYIDEEHREKTRIMQKDLPATLTNMARGVIRTAKDNELSPEDIAARLDQHGLSLPLAAACTDIYRRYQQGLGYRGAVDFQDLIRLALKALHEDPGYLARLQNRYRYILEDEAQDSDELQEKTLRLLSGQHGNWVRVGDPNQSIYETFTTAHPRYLREFIASPAVTARELPNSGRCQPSIIRLANYLIDWSANHHPNTRVSAHQPLTPPYIEPTPPGDPQPNPPDDPSGVVLYPEPLSPGQELEIVVRSVREWLKDNPGRSVAILTPRNRRGFDVVDALKKAKIDYVELLKSSANTREVAGSLYILLNYLADPTAAPLLARCYRVYRRDDKNDKAQAQQIGAVARLLKTCPTVETYLHPHGDDWLDTVDDPDLRDELNRFREWLAGIVGAARLPVDQLVLTIANDLFHDEADLAVAYSLSLRLRQDGLAQDSNRRLGQHAPTWGLTEYADRLAEIARNERRFLGMSEDEHGFDPDQHTGKVTVATMHRAKGLEWDRVYLMSVNNYGFPSAQLHDSYIGERWFARDTLDLEAEARAQLRALLTDTRYTEGDATRDSRIEYAAERLRLLYVGITRARRELIITWNTGRRGDQREASPMVALRTYWEQANQKA
jgi:DNA helicase II / ATP-dependent DNA helicase PcrA